MTVAWTVGARSDLDGIIEYTKQHFPGQLSSLEQRFVEVVARIEQFPKSAPRTQRRGVRVVPLIRYPFRIFYREIPGGIEILYVRHTAQKPL